MNGACVWHHPLGPGEGSKGQLSLNFNNKVSFKDFCTKLYVCSHKKKDIKHIKQDFVLSLGHAPGWNSNAWGVKASRRSQL